MQESSQLKEMVLFQLPSCYKIEQMFKGGQSSALLKESIQLSGLNFVFKSCQFRIMIQGFIFIHRQQNNRGEKGLVLLKKREKKFIIKLIIELVSIFVQDLNLHKVSL